MRAAPVALAVLATSLSASSATARPKKKPPVDVVDISAAKSQLKVLTDSDGGIYVIDSGWRDEHMVFYGDKKAVYQLRIFGGGADGTAKPVPSFEFTFWSPRVDSRTSIGRKATGDYFVQCGDDTEVLKPLADGDARAILDKAAFKSPLWKRQAHFLARDDSGTYYYVDRLRDEAGGKGYRVFVGQAGALKPQVMKNVVADSVGEIFATKNGQLRLVTSSDEASWIKGSAKNALTRVPVENNVRLIYGDLGVYPGGLGTPCDDQ